MKSTISLDVVPVAGKIHSSRLFDTTAIVIDVLRATTCMVLAVQNGAQRVIPTADAGEAAMFLNRLGGRDNLLSGETGGLKTPGFQLGNSPFEFDADTVRGRNVIMSTSNGTAAVCAAANAETVLIGAMINATAVAKAACACSDGKGVLIVCAGTDGMISADDLIVAGAIAAAIEGISGSLACTDTARICQWLYRDYCEGRIDLHSIYHYARLIELGFEKDVEFCFRRDITDVVPVYSNGTIQ